MRKIIITVSMFISCIINIFPQWSTDPNNNLIVGYGLDPHICSDSTGGCYITYNYETTFYPQKLAVERLDRYGYKPWGTLKQILGELPEQWQAEIVEDGEGGVIVSYQDNEWIPPSYYNSKVRVQKVDIVGNFLWGQTGVRVSMETTNHSGQNLVSDGDGGCVIVWADWDGEFSVNRINRFGERVWGDTGIVLAPTGTSLNIVRASDGKYYVQVDSSIFRINQNGEIINQYSTPLWNMIPDPEGGIVLSGTMGNITNLRLVSQRKDSLGYNLWQEPYVEVADSLYLNTKFKIQYNDGYYFYGWSGTKDGINRIAQFQALRLDGSKVFTEASILIIYRTPLSVAGIICSDLNNIIFIWNDEPNLPDSTLAQMYDTLGNEIWDENGIVIAHPAISYQEYTIDRNGGFIISGIINEFTVIAQQVSKYGNLGEIITSVSQDYQEIFPAETTLFQNYPNPFNSTTMIKYTLPKVSEVKLTVYDILGREVITLVNVQQQQGSYEVRWDASNVLSGIYFYQLKTKDYVDTKKMILLK